MITGPPNDNLPNSLLAYTRPMAMNPSLLDLRRIMQFANQAQTPDGQTQRIVDSVSEAVGADICSLYVKDNEKNLLLLASNGLSLHLPIMLPDGAGLVGLIARSRHPLNIAVASSHPDYHFVEGSGEEEFSGFCGVPVVSKGECLGVLVVQSRRARKLGPVDEAFIETLASHLALMLENLILPRMNPSSDNIRILGVNGSSGIGIGFARLVDPVQLSTVTIEHSANTDEEITAWWALL